jgi:hypothetical protein
VNRERVSRRRALAIGGSVAGGLITASSGIAGKSASIAADPAQRLVLNGVTIVDTHDGKLTRDMAILIDNGKIVRIAAAGSIPGSGSVRAVDARGTFAVPGYNDYHAHPLSSSDPEGSLTLMLANGVTGFREMAARPDAFEARRQGKLMPNIDAPELLEIAGETLSGANARTPEAAVAEIQKQKAQGADFIKVIDVSPAVFFAAVTESTRLNLRFLGHLPPSVNVRDATTAGMRSIEHMGPRDSILLGCSSEEVSLRQFMAQNPLPRPPVTGPIPPSVIQRGLANPTVGSDPSEFVRYQRVIDSFNEAKSRDLAAHFVTAGTWLVPTLIRIRTMEVGDDERYRNDQNLRYIPQPTRDMWEDVSREFSTKLSPAARDTLKALFALQMKLVKPFKAAGVPMMAGSDLGGGFVVAGFGLHQEFDLLEQAGLSPLDVLQMTTLNGAKFLGREATMGSVQVGKNANLVLLKANPIASVQNLHAIAAVVRDGNFYAAGALDAMKKKTEARMASGLLSFVAVRPLCC